MSGLAAAFSATILAMAQPLQNGSLACIHLNANNYSLPVTGADHSDLVLLLIRTERTHDV